MGLWLFNFEVSSALNFPFRVLFLKFAGFGFLFFSLYPSVALLWSSEPPDPDPNGPNSSQQRLLCSRSTSSVACGLLWLRLDVRDVHIDVLWVHLTSLYLATCPTSSAWAKTFSTMSLKRARRRMSSFRTLSRRLTPKMFRSALVASLAQVARHVSYQLKPPWFFHITY